MIAKAVKLVIIADVVWRVIRIVAAIAIRLQSISIESELETLTVLDGTWGLNCLQAE